MDISIIFLIALLLFTMYLYLRYSLESFDGLPDMDNENDISNIDNPDVINDNTKYDSTITRNAKKYKADNINVDYHDSAKKLEKDFGYGINLKSYTFNDPNNHRNITTNIPKYLQTPTYNKPGYYKYGYETYVPTYTDSMLLHPRSFKSGQK
tara:strand:- start:1438 stop:1893 length:456 start_codon:yes stop_codon:yes gene_type:complete